MVSDASLAIDAHPTGRLAASVAPSRMVRIQRGGGAVNVSDAFASFPYTCDLVVTRGVHMPAKLERYADRMRKFHGSGYHGSSKDSRESIEYMVRMPLAAPALLHRASHRPTTGDGPRH
jgi:hypothetical protein